MRGFGLGRNLNEQTLIVRKSSLRDIPKLREFEQGVITAERPYDESLKDELITYYDLEALVTDENSEILVVEHDNELIGSGYAQLRKSKPYVKNEYFSYLGFMYVSPDHRGMGVNKLILDALFEWSKSKGVYTVCLDVYEKNQSAVRAYEKAGFVKDMVKMGIELDK